eukprot:355956-Chlamydomonas_euryale.AAC.2
MWHVIAGVDGSKTDPSVDGARSWLLISKSSCGNWPRGTPEVGTVSQKHQRFSRMYSSAIQGCHEEGSDGDATFGGFLELTCRTERIPWPES